MNEQEQAIAKIQRMLDYYIQQTLRLLENTIERKAEVLPVNELIEDNDRNNKVPLQIIGSWLAWLTNTIANFSDWELRRADREVKDIADGYYDGRIRKYENGNGLSR